MAQMVQMVLTEQMEQMVQMDLQLMKYGQQQAIQGRRWCLQKLIMLTGLWRRTKIVLQTMYGLLVKIIDLSLTLLQSLNPHLVVKVLLQLERNGQLGPRHRA